MTTIASWTDGDTEPPLGTPFELWCESAGLHPETFGVWELFQQLAQPRAD